MKMDFPELNQRSSATEKLNKLLIRCTDFRKQLTYYDYENLKDKEYPFKEVLIEKYHQLANVCNRKSRVTVDVYIEEALEREGPCKLPCDLNLTVRTIKSIIAEKWRKDACIENMYVLCGNKLAEEWNTLEQCGVQCDGDILYIYIANKRPCKQSSVSSSIECNHVETSISFLEITEMDTEVQSNTMVYSSSTASGTESVVTQAGFSNKDVNLLSNTIEVQTNEKKDESSAMKIGWHCSVCTYINEPTRPGCELCSNPRPDDYQMPEGYIPSQSEQIRMEEEKKADEMTSKLQKDKLQRKEERRKQNYQRHLSAVQQNLTVSVNTIDCSICLTETKPGEAIVLAGCLHSFCRDCLAQHIIFNEEVMIKCPYVDDSHSCSSYLAEHEIRSLLPQEKFEQYLTKSLETAAKVTSNSFHCQTADCYGWCEYDDGVNIFNCPVCNHTNCLTCKAIHENQNCKEYQDQLFKSDTDASLKKTRKMLQQMVKQNDAMHCPRCNIIILKKEGCDWLRCSMCQLEICWVTKGPRWGPNGAGDTSGGCKCRLNGKKCHPKCLNCH